MFRILETAGVVRNSLEDTKKRPPLPQEHLNKVRSDQKGGYSQEWQSKLTWTIRPPPFNLN